MDFSEMLPLPPQPPHLEPMQIREFIRYAEQMADYIEADIELAKRARHAAVDHSDIAKGWRFTALAVAETYDGEF
jgi:hypothetical protein